ncbi:MAG: hypothetical protein LBV29_03005 [Azoarcus sp.]|nr:hypothetical protein [Azoarcus sp.]
MNHRIQYITNTLLNVASNPATFDQLSAFKGAQVSIVYGAARYNHNQYTWYSKRRDSGEYRPGETEEMLTKSMNQHRTAYLRQLFWLQSIARYVEAGTSYASYDDAYYNSEEGLLENDEVHLERVATSAHPYAWARQSLINKGEWLMSDDGEPQLVEDFGTDISLGLEIAADRIASRTLQRMLSSYIKHDDMPYNIENDLIAMQTSPQVKRLVNALDAERAVLRLAKLTAFEKPHKDYPDATTHETVQEQWDALEQRDVKGKHKARLKQFDRIIEEAECEAQEAVVHAKMAVASASAITAIEAIIDASNLSDEVAEKLKADLIAKTTRRVGAAL